jgi:hypothetical protein
MKKNITIIAASLLLGTQMVDGAAGRPATVRLNPYFRFLSLEEQRQYKVMRKRFVLNRRGLQNFDSFGKILFIIKAFVYGESGREEVRGLACGVFFSGPFIAVNNGILRIFLDKSKSSINDSFKRLGYESVGWSEGIFNIVDLLPPPRRKGWIMRKNPAADDGAPGAVPPVLLPQNSAADDGNIWDPDLPFGASGSNFDGFGGIDGDSSFF